MTDVVVDADPALWVLVDPALDADPDAAADADDDDEVDVDAWALQQAERLWAQGTLPRTDLELAELAAGLLVAAELALDHGTIIYAWLPDLRQPPAPLVELQVVDAEPDDDIDAALRELAGEGEPDLDAPTVITPIETPLGVALHGRRHQRDPDGPELRLALTVAWHLPAEEIYLRLHTAGYDLGRMAQVAPAFLDLARAVRTTPTPDP